MEKNRILNLAPNGYGGIAEMARNLEETSFSKLQFETFYTKPKANSGLIGYLPRLLKFYRRILTFSPAIIQVNLGSGGSLYRKFGFVLISKLTRKTIFLQLHSAHLPEYLGVNRKFRQSVFKAILKWSSRVLTLTAADELWLESSFPGHSGKFFRLGNFTSALSQRAVESPSLSGPLELIYIGRFEIAKGVLDIGKLVELIEDDWRIRFVGQGSLTKSEILSTFPEKDWQRIEFIPWVSDKEYKSELLDTSDVLLLPSHFENYPLVILEAFSRGRPVIATRVGAISQIIRDRIDGLTYGPGSHATAAIFLRELSRGRENLVIHCEAAYEAYLNRFTSTSFEIQYQELIEHLA